jgi:sec-independent protein translocase protein TatA
MGRIGMPELLIILAIVIVIFGANRLPGLGRGIGSAIKNFKDEMGPDRDKDKDDDEKERNRKAS